MAELGSALNSMTTRFQEIRDDLDHQVQERTRQVIRNEQLASVGFLAAGVAHEINNPLSGILIYTKLIYKQLNNQEFDPTKKESMLKHLKLIENETKRCGDIVKGLLDFSRKDQNGFEPKHLHEILHETFELMSHPMKVADISFLSDFNAKTDLINCSPNQIKQICIAILVNASEAVAENGEVLISPSPFSATASDAFTSIAIQICLI